MKLLKHLNNTILAVSLSLLGSGFVISSSYASDHLRYCERNGQCITPGNVGVGFAIGYGQRSSSLVDVHDMDIFILPELYYYGRHFFFDNGTAGWRIDPSTNVEWSVVARVNPERSFFDEHYLGMWLESPFQSGNSDAVHLPSFTDPEDDPVGGSSGGQGVSVRSVSEREYSIDLGFQFDTNIESWHVRGQLFNDALSRHKGYSANVSLVRNYYLESSIFSVRMAAAYKSEKLIDYYYGISFEESPSHHYEAEASWQPSVSLSWQKPLSGHWRLLGIYQYLQLGNGISNSPLVHSDSVTTWFLGVGYRF
ncbi:MULTISPECIES: MipA/OmpV family protein [Gammaproteobacteria]|uniref:MipA/OmpV family protein n=1 Tax=Gammaproteobacteria TaxID=1236 RepID=UPI0014041DA6|nr:MULTISPECIES: MipA/OmpV family protein [Gammaproteobacteria]